MDRIFKNIQKPILFLGVGNELKGDDAAGPLLVSKLRFNRDDINMINCGPAPENYLKKIIAYKPKTIIFVDAVEMGEKPGTTKIFTTDQIQGFSISTHGTSLDLLSDFIKNEIDVEIYLLGIQPKTMSLNEKISPEVEEAILKLEKYFLSGGLYA